MSAARSTSTARRADIPALEGRLLDDRYQVGPMLGSGGMGAVFEAEHIRIRRRFALKVLRPKTARNEGFVARFMQEARAASLVRHPNVVEIFDFGELEDGTVYSVMERLEGEDLGARLRREHIVPWSEARSILRQIASALHAAHGIGVIHRDIKPGNCFLVRAQREGEPLRVKVLDFGIAKLDDDLQEGDQPLTMTGEVLGTPKYMAPELARGKPATPLTDVYALGVLAYRMLTGRVPFDGRNVVDVLCQHASDAPKAPRFWQSGIPVHAEALVLQMLAKAPEQRPQGMGAIERCLTDAELRTTQVYESSAIPVRRRHVQTQVAAQAQTPTLPSVSIPIAWQAPPQAVPMAMGPMPYANPPTASPARPCSMPEPIRARRRRRWAVGTVLGGGVLGLAGLTWFILGSAADASAESRSPRAAVMSDVDPLPAPQEVTGAPQPKTTTETTEDPALALHVDLSTDEESPDTDEIVIIDEPSAPGPKSRRRTHRQRPEHRAPSDPPDEPVTAVPDETSDDSREENREAIERSLRNARSALREGKRNAAATHFKQVLKSSPEHRGALSALADLYFDQSQYARSALYARRLLTLDSGDVSAYLRLGDAYFGAERYDDALEAYEQARARGSAKARARIDKVQRVPRP